MPVDGLAAPARARGVAALHYELPDDPVELGLVVVVLQAQLHKVPARLGRLPRPQLDLTEQNRLPFLIVVGVFVGSVKAKKQR